ncbi:hypothetical protein RJ639_015265 [Escallonia herrerae]|uniref:Peptidase A1 domain-containing protein n=1 Tax=Escallonia herrerae TaxID=1293975 RepID=A0AA89ANY2_9ASTE|nr:hypothetical protein RJ639_015265 [Escallonia herrerae]
MLLDVAILKRLPMLWTKGLFYGEVVFGKNVHADVDVGDLGDEKTHIGKEAILAKPLGVPPNNGIKGFKGHDYAEGDSVLKDQWARSRQGYYSDDCTSEEEKPNKEESVRSHCEDQDEDFEIAEVEDDEAPKASKDLDDEVPACIEGTQDLSNTIGVLSSDTFTFASAASHGRSVSLHFPKSTFGCVHTTNGSFDSHAAGLIGLGRGPLSLITELGEQINHKFSYCLLPATSNTTSKLRFGDQAVLTGNGLVSTPIFSQPEDPSYYLKLEAVSIGEKRIVNSHFTPAGEVEAAVRDAISLKAIKDPDPESKIKLCYDTRSFDRYPEIKIVFHFTGASVTLKTVDTFLGDEKITCLAMAATEGDAFFGNLAQINFQVEYDLASNQEKDLMVTILRECGFYPVRRIENLKDRGLLTVDDSNKLMIHRLLQQMGKEIIRQKAPDEAGKRCRSWCHEDSLNVLKENTSRKSFIIDDLRDEIKTQREKPTEDFMDIRLFLGNKEKTVRLT